MGKLLPKVLWKCLFFSDEAFVSASSSQITLPRSILPTLSILSHELHNFELSVQKLRKQIFFEKVYPKSFFLNSDLKCLLLY